MKRCYGLTVFIFTLLLLSACGGATTTQGDQAQQGEATQGEGNSTDYPEKQVEVVVPVAAGGASDMVSRTIAAEMEKELGVPVVVTNKAGGSGAPGMYSVRDASADGYTVGYVPVELSMLESLGLAEISPEDFTALGQLMTIPSAITVRSDAPYSTLEEFIQYANQNPGEVNIGNSGTGSIWHIAAAAFAQAAEIDVEHVPYEGAAPAVSALMGGHIDAVTVSTSEALSGIESGDFKVLAVMSDAPDANVPDIPTLQDLGYDVNLSGWGGFVVPKETPQDIVETLQAAFKTAYDSEAFQKLLEERGMTPGYKAGGDFQSFAKEQYDYFSEIISQIEFE
ncbi:tripartite tricarboxylate transporter substrate binding protein [Bacillaceae bacterium SIJ1]|uniref:tripartite tricarboxylate transporter substrate binding protein n=1 Tax=Litoribacterium kuwaitense TaxID=1398745 RepID=UPI0013EE0041|nr:tripartite tricarboxylate transporter substrate binding protein [Litoribacterium kuwaitense]NGP45754.1 tripartite tricarboxylate transporter substrate binding protein [Litoribacterium kuwaitense]